MLAAGVGETFSQIVVDGPLLVAMGVAALVGLIGFLSPCVLPLVPGYLSYVAGLAGAEAGRIPDSQVHPAGAVTTAQRRTTPDTRARRRVLLGAVLFVLGFTAVFFSFGALFGGLGRLLLEHAQATAAPGVTAYRVFTGKDSTRNLRMYRKAGFRVREVLDGPSGPAVLVKKIS